MTRSIIIYAGILALLALGLQWVEYQYFAKVFATEIYVIVLVIAFTALGIWLGMQLTPTSQAAEFAMNEPALMSLGISKRELCVLEALAAGNTNKEIARQLNVSPNTVKTHVANLYQKLDVGQRVQAVQKARELRLIP